MNRKQIEGVTFRRVLKLDRESIKDDKRSINASLSSEYPVERFFGTEVLRHDEKSVNLERAGDNGLPLLFGHDHSALIGRARKVRVEGGRLTARLDFSENSERAREVWSDIRDGFLTDISLGYEINDIEETDERAIVTRFTPLEASVVSVPADPTVGINRSKSNEDKPEMTDKKTEDKTGERGEALSVASFKTAQTEAEKRGAQEGIKRERERVSDIEREFSPFMARAGVPELRRTCIDAGVTVDQAKSELLEHIAGVAEPAADTRAQSESHHGQRLESGKDEADKWREGAAIALELRGGLIRDREKAREARAGNPFISMSLSDMARDYLVRERVNLAGMSRQDIAGQAFTRAGMHTTSDFTSVLENIATKSLLMGYNEAPETWQAWARTGSLADFKAASRVNVSTFSDLAVVVESAEYQEGHMSDLKETIQLVTYGKTFTISRQAIINDDVDAFTRIPASMGRAAARQVGDIAYAILTANGTLTQDGVALFDAAGHSNDAASGGAITETTLDAGRLAMSTQTAPAPASGETGATLNISPAFLIVPSALLMTARKIVETPTAPDTTGDLAINTMRNALTIVWDARLDANDANAWYLAAAPNMADTVEVAFLDGNDQPYIESQDGFKQDGVSYKVRIDAAAAALDYRGLYRNDGGA